MNIKILVTPLLTMFCLSAVAESIYNIPVTADKFHHITFKRIDPNQYEFNDGQLQIQVNKSASFALMPFGKTRKVKSIAFEWKSSGTLNIRDAAMEETRRGDDAVMRVGLLLAGPAPELPVFAPAWAREVQSLLKIPSNNMIYLMPATKHLPGSMWDSPYNENVSLLAVNSTDIKNQWQQSKVQFEKPLEVVGLWIMADGDNTASTFTAWLRKIELSSR